MTYRLQYSAAEHHSLLTAAIDSWAREDKDLRLISVEGHVIFTSCRLFALSTSSLAPLLSSWTFTSSTLPSISLPFSSNVISALVALLSVGIAQVPSTLGKEVEEAAACLGLSGFSCNTRSAAKPKGVGLSILPVPVKKEIRDIRQQAEAPCHLCPKIFSHRKHLNRHIDMKHPGEQNPGVHSEVKETSEQAAIFKCQECNKNFVSEEKLERHGKTHVEGGGFSCGKCSKSFLTQKRLRKHMRSHMELTNQCDVCEKSFQNMGTLALHRNIHLDQKPFKCGTCGKDFSQKGNLKTHMQKHHGQEMNDSIVIAGVADIEEEMMLEESDFPKMNNTV